MKLPHPPTIAAFAFAVSLSPFLRAAAQPEAAPKPMLTSAVFDWTKLPARVTPNGERRDVANNPTPTLAVFESHITTLNPGQVSHQPHQHLQEELIIVKEGNLEVHINGKTQPAGPGSVLFYASNDMHAVKNVGNTRATYWVVNLATTVTQTPAEHIKSPTLQSGVWEWANLKAESTKTGERRAILKGSTRTMNDLSVHATTLNPREAPHAAHRHPDEELVLVKEGAIEVNINGQTHLAPTGSVVLYASNDLHGMRNAGDTRTTYYVIRVITAATPKAAPAAK